MKEILENKYSLYYFALKSVYELHREYKFGKSPLNQPFIVLNLPTTKYESSFPTMIRFEKVAHRLGRGTNSSNIQIPLFPATHLQVHLSFGKIIISVRKGNNNCLCSYADTAA